MHSVFIYTMKTVRSTYPTLSRYQRDLKQFYQSLFKPSISLLDVEPDHIQRWIT